MIDNNSPKKIYVRRVDNRQSQTLVNVIDKKITPCSLFCTDGYLSYPSVADILSHEHLIVITQKDLKHPMVHTQTILRVCRQFLNQKCENYIVSKGYKLMNG
ncbi:hypothetical protein DMUE_2052 [Dictyocoela muelleri]|nr:hypothetical protein DMUE_2052 [Dictyocoela muelleri]